ncbi:MAG: GGDEF domain-containing protein [Ruminococcus sp.]|nr:GGDEF domain-containing protein [Ruminococcus sp.]
MQDLTQKACSVGRVTVDKQYHMREADADFLDFFGNDVIYSILRTMHPDDADLFCATTESLRIGERDRCILRARNADGVYVRLLVTIQASSDKDGSLCYRLTFRDVFRMDALLLHHEHENRVYRHLLTMMRDVCFAYRMGSRQLIIYQFDCFRDIILLRSTLSEWQQQLKNEHLVDRGDLGVLSALCKDIENGTYRFQHELDASFLSGGVRMEHISVQGITLWDSPEDGSVIGTISVIHPKSKAKDINLTLETNRDSLTELLNKQAIVSYAKSQIAAKPKGLLSVVLVDVDDFKDLTDRYGHMFGDEVLYTISHIIKAEIGRRGMAGRIGGSIFQIVLEDIRDETDLRGILRAIRTKIEWAFVERKKSLKVTCSIGAACYPIDADNYDALFMQADKALYIASAKGKNRYVIYDVNKHGEALPNRERSVADLYANVPKPTQSKAGFVADTARSLLREEAPDLFSLMQNIGEQFGVDGIHIFAAPEQKAVYSWGHPVNGNAAVLLEEPFARGFGEDSVCVVDNINALENVADDAYRWFAAENMLGAVLYRMMCSGKPMGVIAFGLFGRFRKWSTLDVNHLTVLGGILAALMEKYYFSQESEGFLRQND